MRIVEVCGVCGEECKSKRALTMHLNKHHPDVRHADYYKRYIMPNSNVGICSLDGCDNDTKFDGISVGFRKYCCKKHSNADNGFNVAIV